MLSVERWLPVVGAEGKYSVSDLGRVRSERRVVLRSDGRTQTIPERICSTPPDGRGYHRVVIFYETGTTGVTRMVHQLVLESFIGPIPGGDTHGRHLNGDPRDNRPGNLSWGTRSENFLDSVEHGTHKNSKKTHCPAGHSYSPENTYVCPGRGARHCRTCMANNRRDRVARARAKGA